MLPRGGAQPAARPAAPAQPGQRLSFPGQGPGEVVNFILRPHWLWYIVCSWRIVLLGIILLGVFFVGQILAIFGVPSLIFWASLAVLFGVHMIRWISLDLNTWIFRKYILTDWRLIDDLGWVYQIHREASLDRIQDIKVQRANVFAMWFDIGDIEIRTAGQHGDLMLEGLHHPQQIAKVIRLQLITKDEKYEAKPVPIRNPALRAVWDRVEETDDPAPPVPAPRPSARHNLPIEFLRGEIVLECIKRHWFYLLLLELRPLAVAAGALIVWLLTGVTGSIGGFAPIWLLVGGVTIALAWAVLIYFNYADDYLILTTHRIIELDRLFFVLADCTNEVRYSKVQDINVDVSTLGHMFGFGTITIETAGRINDIIVTYLPDPHGVMDRIYSRIDAAQGRTQRLLRSIRRKEFRRWIGILLNEMLTEVPDVRGLTMIEAAARARRLGLKLIVQEERQAEGVPPGVVLDQTPFDGATALRGNELCVVLSGRTP